MKKRMFLKILVLAVVIGITAKIMMLVFAEPWLEEKIELRLNEKSSDYSFDVSNTRILVFKRGIEMEGIVVKSAKSTGNFPDMIAKIASVKIYGVKILKVVFNYDYDISEICISNINIEGKLPLSKPSGPPIISPLNLSVNRVLLEEADIGVNDYASSTSYAVINGMLQLYNIQIEKRDTISPEIIRKLDFKAEKIVSVSSDSMYTFIGNRITYSSDTNNLLADSFGIHPNYSSYAFTSRHKYQTDRFDAGFQNIFLRNFDVPGIIGKGNIICSSVEIAEMELAVFRDKRKEFRHINKPLFQEMIYNYPGIFSIDTILLSDANVRYTEHAEDASEAGSLNFNKLHAELSNLTNDTIYKTESGFIKLKADALLMGKGKVRVLLNGRLYDPDNRFSISGKLSEMEASELNPFLEKNAFLFITKGRIDAMEFSFMANNTESNGSLTMRYHGLEIAVKNKQSGDTTAIKEIIISSLMNAKILNSNPEQNEEVRVAIIDYKRDPERSLFSYAAKSILSGIKASLVKDSEK